MSGRATFADYLARMAALGFRPSTARGQNFLLDPSLHGWLAAQAGAGPADTVVEIGVGLGFLTRELARLAGRVVGLEVDARLLGIAREELRGCGNVELVLADALGGPGRTMHPAVATALLAARARGGRALLVANLPYSISGPLLAEVATLEELPDRAVVLVQKELAQRVAAPAGSADYGGLSVLVQALFTAASLRDVSPQVFRPRPKVTSAVLQLDRRAHGPGLGPAGARREFAAFVRALFQQRRKTLRTTLHRAAAAIGRRADAAPPELLAGRAEDHEPDEVVRWWRELLS